MPNFTVTRRYHAECGRNVPGDVETVTVLYPDLDAAIERSESINVRFCEMPYHVTGVVLDSRNFCMFDLSTLSECLPGFDDLPWNQLPLAA